MGLLSGVTHAETVAAQRQWVLMGAQMANSRPAARAAARLALGPHDYKLDQGCAAFPLAAGGIPDPAFTGHILAADELVGAKELRLAVQAGVRIADVCDANGNRPGDILIAAVNGANRLEDFQFRLWKLSEAARLKVPFDADMIQRTTRERRPAIIAAIAHGYSALDPALESGRCNLKHISPALR